jgi:hypothetical protein
MSKRPVQKLLDVFKPPEKAGRLRSFCGLTYELQSDFFETELLPGLFNLGLWQTRGWSSRIALERYLDESYIGVVMEGRCYHGRPSLRIDLATHADPRGFAKQHAKLYLLHFEDCIRLVVGSANLTDKAFRAHREVLVAIDCTPQQPEAEPLIHQAVTGWLEHLGSSSPEGMRDALERVRITSAAWSRERPGKEPPTARFLWGGSERSLPEMVADAWPAGETVTTIDIVSPFWSCTDASAPQALVTSLRSRGHLDSSARIRILAEARVDSHEPVPSLPDVLVEWAKALDGLEVSAAAVDPTLSVDEREAFSGVDVSLIRRSLHAKVLLLSGTKSSLVYVGSANCTAGGWGTRGPAANIEAGLLFVSRKGHPFRTLLPATGGHEINLAECRPADVSYTVDETPTAPWPTFLREARLHPAGSEDRLRLTLAWREGEPRQVCEIRVPRAIDAPLWQGPVASQASDIELSSTALETLLVDRELVVRWGEPLREARFPVLVDERAKHDLPLAPDIRLPGEQALLQYYQGRVRWEDLFPEPGVHGAEGESAPSEESAVDTSRILAYQMREFVEALPGLLSDLSNVPHEERAWRRSLRGPVSPLKLARYVRSAFVEQKRSGTAALFQLLELQLALIRVRAQIKEPPDWFEQVFAEARTELETLIEQVKAAAGANGAIASFERGVRAEMKKLRPTARQ